MLWLMKDPSDRLREARVKAGYSEATEAARAFGWNPVTYLAHENGGRGLRPAVAERYARAFKIRPEWLLYSKNDAKSGTVAERPTTVPLVGYVGAGATTSFFGDQAEHDTVPAPENATPKTVAVEIRGDSLGDTFDRWLVFYDDVQRPVVQDQIGKLCVVGLDDGRVLVKKVQRSRVRGLFHLLSNTEAPILDVPIAWAAKVKNMMPR